MSTNFGRQDTANTDIKKIPEDVISRLDSRISSLPKGESMKIGKILSHLGLWRYRQQIYSQRRLNVLHLKIDETSLITFIADVNSRAITADDINDYLDRPRLSEWDRRIHKLKIWRIIYKDERLDLY